MDLPGTLWVNRGRWNWRVKLPGDDKRKNYPLKLPGQKYAIPEDKGESLAISLAWRIWERRSREQPKPAAECGTLEDVAARFLAWADTYYRKIDGTPTREAYNCEVALRPLREKLGKESIDNISYGAILDLRDDLEGSGLNRTTVNQRVGIWKRFIAWALENRLCAPATKSEWWAIGNLKRGRTQAPESEPVTAVRHLDVKRTLPYLSDMSATMVRVQELCGARPGEVCIMRPCDIEKRRDVWIYRPWTHKTKHRDQVRVIVLGPRAIHHLSSYMDSIGAAPDEPLFRPPRVRHDDKTPWGSRLYAQSVACAIRQARKDKLEVADWSPNQLRHACGTRVRRKFGHQAASIVLGHSQSSRITDRYTRDAIEEELIASAIIVMRRIG
jgi:integrase